MSGMMLRFKFIYIYWEW